MSSHITPAWDNSVGTLISGRTPRDAVENLPISEAHTLIGIAGALVTRALDTDVFVPETWILVDELFHELDTPRVL